MKKKKNSSATARDLPQTYQCCVKKKLTSYSARHRSMSPCPWIKCSLFQRHVKYKINKEKENFKTNDLNFSALN